LKNKSKIGNLKEKQAQHVFVKKIQQTKKIGRKTELQSKRHIKKKTSPKWAIFTKKRQNCL